MAEETQAVEQAGEAAASGVEQEVSTAPETDPEAELIALKERLAKVESDRDNYRKGLLAMKGKTEVENLDLTDPTQLQVYIDKTVQEKLSQTESAQAKAAFEAQALANAKALKELKRTLNSKNASTSIAGGAGQGSGQAKSEVQTSYWSPEQIADLKKRGWDDKKIQRAADLARQKA